MADDIDFKKLTDYLQFDNEHIGYGNYFCNEVDNKTLIFVGKSQVGKSGIVKSIINPRYALSKGIYSETRNVSHYTLTVFDYNLQKTTSLELIDTPGLYETRFDINEQRSNKVLLNLITSFIDYNITFINVVCFVVDIDQTVTEIDIDAWKSLIDLMGDDYGEISLLIFSHCDRKTEIKSDELILKFITGDNTKFIADYCKLGYIKYGVLDKDDVESISNDDDVLKKTIVESKLKKLEIFRKSFFEKILATKIKKHITFINKIKEQTQEKINEIKENHKNIIAKQMNDKFKIEKDKLKSENEQLKRNLNEEKRRKRDICSPQ